MIRNTLIILIWCSSINAHYTIFDSHIIHQMSSYPIFDCVYAYLIEDGKETGKPYLKNSHLIPYCRRPDDNDTEDNHSY